VDSEISNVRIPEIGRTFKTVQDMLGDSFQHQIRNFLFWCQLEYLPSQILLKAWHNWGVKPRSWCLSTFLELSQLIYCSALTIPVFKWTEKANKWVHPWVCNVRLKYWNTLRDHILFSAMSLLLHENDHKHHLEHTGCLSNADSCLQTLCKVSNWWISLLKLRRNSNYLNGTSAKPVFSAIEFSVTIDWP
jgi:hypothetical protein